MGVMFLKLVGGLLLLWIAVKLMVPTEEHGEESVKAGDTLMRAVWLVTVADIVMSLDNVIAIAAAAETAAMRVDVDACAGDQDDVNRVRPCHQRSADHRGQRAADEDHGTLSDPGVGRRGSARLGRRRNHRQGCGGGRATWARSSSTRSTCGQRPWARCFVLALGWLIRRSKHKGALEHPLIVDPPGPEEFPPRTVDRA